MSLSEYGGWTEKRRFSKQAPVFEKTRMALEDVYPWDIRSEGF